MEDIFELNMPEPPRLDGEEVVSNSAGKTSALQQGTEIPAGWKPTAAEPVPVVRCHMIKKDGERCGRWSLRGHTHCVKHSGSLPNVRAKAEAIVESSRMRLLNLTDEAVDVLEDFLKPGTSDMIRLKAAENVLNRSGIKDAVEVNVTVEHGVSYSEEIAKKLDIMRQRVLPQPEPEDLGEREEILDAEEVDNDNQDTV